MVLISTNVPDLRDVSIEFSNESLDLLNICLGIIMFGIALGIDLSDFLKVKDRPKSVLIGVTSQFLLLPLITWIFISIITPPASLALGMILVAACPGGNISNFISSISKSNVALSVTLTAVATLLTPLLTPLNFELWAWASPITRTYLQSFDLNYGDILLTVLTLLLIPLILGMLVRHYFPKVALGLLKPVRWLSILILFSFIGIGLWNNFEVFKIHFATVFWLVLLHNALALAVGYGAAKWSGLPVADRQTICIETGIQNSGLGLIIIFAFFQGNGGMAIIAAWWGIWHIISGMSLAYYFAKRPQLTFAT